MSNALVMITFREQSSMASAWKEYLCVRRLSNGRARLEICRYEALAENSFFDDDGNELPIPKHINGKVVAGVEDDYVVGGDLSCQDTSDVEYALEFGRSDKGAVTAWLKDRRFKLTESELRELWNAAA